MRPFDSARHRDAVAQLAQGGTHPLPEAGSSREEGQAMTEMLLMTVFLMLLVFGIVHIAMLLTTKVFINYAAFAAARTYMTEASTTPASTPGTQAAADEATRYLNWWGPDAAANRKDVQLSVVWDKWARASPTVPGKVRTGLTVTYRVPFGLPLQVAPPGGVAMTSFAPTEAPPAPVVECGDNANVRTEAIDYCKPGYYQCPAGTAANGSCPMAAQ